MRSVTSYLKLAVSPETSTSEEELTRTRALHVIFWTLAGVGIVLLIIVSLLPDFGPVSRLFGPVALVYLLAAVSLILNVRGKSRLVSVVFILTASVAITWIAMTAGGMRAAAVIWYVTIVAMAGLLLGEMAGFLTAGLVSILSLGLVFMEVTGNLPADLVTHSPILQWVGLFLAVIAIASIQFLAARTVREAYSRTRKELHERERSEALFRAVVENSYDAVVLLDINRQIKYVSPSFFRIGGYEPHEIEATYGPRYTHPDDLPYTELKFRKVLESPGTSVVLEYRIRHKQGHWIWVEGRIVNLLDTPDMECLVLNLRDVTDRKLAEEALRESESYYRALVNNTPDIVSGFDRDGRYRFINDSVAKVSVNSPGHFIGKSVGEIPEFGPEQAAQRLRLIRQVFETRQPYEGEFHFRALGRDLTYEWRVYPVLDPEGNVLSVLSIGRDITDRKKADEALTDSLEQLHALSMELEHAREQERKTTAREVHDELGQILTAIRMSVEKIGRAPGGGNVDSDPGKQYLLDLVDHGIHAVQRIAARLRPGILDDLGLLPAIEWRVEEFQKQSGLRCSLSLPETEPTIDDERSTALFRILGELLTNVARHAKASAVAVSLADSADEFTLSVTDNGIGFSHTETQSPHALGFKGIKERLYPFGGQCVVRPDIGQGSQVVIHLPKKDRARRSHQDRESS